MTVILWIAFLFYQCSSCLGENRAHNFGSYYLGDGKDCKVGDEVLQKDAKSAIICVALCVKHPLCVSVFYKEETNTCTGCRDVYYDFKRTFPNKDGTKYYIDTHVTTGWNCTQGRCYRLFTVVLLPWEAQVVCSTLKGHLAKVDSAEANKMVEHLMIADNVHSAIIGLSDEHTEGNYRWLADGSTLTYNNWMEWNYNRGTINNCVCVVKDYDYKWMDLSCTHEVTYICSKNI